MCIQCGGVVRDEGHPHVSPRDGRLPGRLQRRLDGQPDAFVLTARLRPGESMFGFFFQAEDGIRDLTVTGVQTCALPISFVGLRQAGKHDEILFYFGAAGLILFYEALEHGYEAAHRDELTGLPGRRTLKELDRKSVV